MRTRAAGFTLIEVLVALAIVTIGMAAVLESLSSAANTISYLRDETLAEWVGLNQVATTRLNLQPGQVPMTGNTQGEIDYAGRSWHWRQEVIETQVKGMVRIDVKVRPAEVKAGDDNGWYVTVSGIAGDALAPMQGTTPLWSNGTGLQGSGNCPPGQLDCNPTPNCQPGQANCNPTPNSCAAGSLGCNNQNSGGNTSNSGGLGGNTNSTGGLGGGSNGRNPPPTPQNQGAGP